MLGSTTVEVVWLLVAGDVSKFCDEVDVMSLNIWRSLLGKFNVVRVAICWTLFKVSIKGIYKLDIKNYIQHYLNTMKSIHLSIMNNIKYCCFFLFSFLCHFCSPTANKITNLYILILKPEKHVLINKIIPLYLLHNTNLYLSYYIICVINQIVNIIIIFTHNKHFQHSRSN